MAENELIVVEKLNALDLFTGEAMDPVIAQIKALVDKHVPDVSTAKGRGEIASLARRVASSKVVLDDLGKNLVADWKEKAKKVDVVRKRMRDELDALRDSARLPLTNWEVVEAERFRQEELERALEVAWEEAHAERDLRERERIVREKEAEQARLEAERKAKEESERLERERKEREERIALEAAERAKREAETAIQRERERAEKAERAAEEAAARAKEEQEAWAVLRAEQQAREEGERKERERLIAEKAERERQEKITTNKRHRLALEHAAVDSATDEGLPDPEAWILAIAAGKIKHVTINY
jgi:colicin import membrane protein